MSEFPNQGKKLEECTAMLEEAARTNKMSYGVMMWGVESLRDSPEDMRAYFQAYESLVAKDVQEQVARDTPLMAVQQVKEGKSISEVAHELACDRFRGLINHYNTTEVHEKWNAAIPDLRAAGGLASLV
jgi:hypothetical protein